MRFQFRVNNVEMGLRLRARRDASIEVVALDSVVGEFFLDGSELLEARDIKLAAALRPQMHGGGWKIVTMDQAITMLVGVNRPVRQEH